MGRCWLLQRMRRLLRVWGAVLPASISMKYQPASNTIISSAVETAVFSSRQSGLKGRTSWSVRACYYQLRGFCVLNSWENSTTAIISISRNPFWL